MLWEFLSHGLVSYDESEMSFEQQPLDGPPTWTANSSDTDCPSVESSLPVVNVYIQS